MLQKKIFTLYISILLLVQYCTAQQTSFRRFTVENGLQNNIVFAATQDSKNLMWFATGTGIDRFDGNKFTHYALPTKDDTYAENLQVPFILSTPQNQIWAASANAIFAYNVKKNIFEIPKTIGNWVEQNKNILNINLSVDGKNLLIASTNSFASFNLKNQALRQSSKINQNIRYIFQDKKGMIWIGTNKGILRGIENENNLNILTETIPVFSSIANTAVTHISQDNNGNIWLVTNNEGVFVYNETNTTLTKVALAQSNRYAIKDIFHHINNGEHFISLDGGGVLTLNNDLIEKSRYTTNEDDVNSLSNNAAYDIFVDKYNQIWVTTYGGGVNLISQANQTVTNYTHQINNSNSLGNNAAKAITQTANGYTWFATRKGISKLQDATNTWQHLNEFTTGGKFTSDNVLSLANSDNDVWAGTYGGGLMRINGTTNAITSYKTDPNNENTIGTDFVYAVLVDSKGNVWTGGIKGNLCYFDKTQNKFFRIKTPVAAISQIIEESGTGNIICATEKGVFVVKGNELVNYSPFLQTEKILSILEFDKNNYWIGTLGGGVIQVNLVTKKTKKLQTNEGLPSNVISAMIKDLQGDVWIGTSKGLVNYNKKNGVITAYSKADGLAGSQINYGALFLSNQGEVILGTTDGFSRFHPNKITNGGYPPNIVFTNLTVNNKLVNVMDTDSPLTEQLDEVEKITLKSNQNSISIDFVNTSPELTGKHLYSWKLEGFDKDWSLPSTIPTAIYTNLNSGTYTLYIKAFAKGQVENAQIRKLIIKIKAPWWATGWAIAAYLLLIAAGILAVYNYQNIRATRQKYADRLHLNTSISHEIRTPLTLIKGPVSALANAENLNESDRTNLALAKKNIEKLETIIAQFIDYQKTGVGKMQMQVQKSNIIPLMDDICASFVPLMKEKNIHFTYTKPSEAITLFYDKDKIEKVFNNLLSNAVKYTPSNKDITVSITKDAKDIIISVLDTGIGIPKLQQRFIFNGYFRADNTINLKETGSGIGLNVAKEFVEMHKGKIEFKSDSNSGTLFTVKLPLENEALLPYLAKDGDANKSLFIPEIESKETLVSNKRILLVEDNDELRQYLKNELTNAGYKTSEAANGAIALQLIAKQQPDLIITDVMMPEMNGFQFCSAVKKEISTCHIPVIMLTAIHDKDYLVEGYRSGADDYVKKPFDITHIIARMENLLQNRMRFRNKIMSVFEQENTSVNDDVDISWLKKATELIVEHLQDPDFSVEKLSGLMAMSRPVLFRKFKTLANESPQQYIIQIRLRKSIELLQQRQLNISQVAYECGFADPKYFSTAFKKHFDKTPGEYIKSIMA